MADEVKQNAKIASYGSEYNAQTFLIKSVIKNLVSTAIPVRVDSIERPADASGAGYLSATPLVCQRAGDGKALEPVSIPRLPFFRYQHGSAAVICDPKPGDIGLAVFAQQDTSNLKGGKEPVAPSSFRCFDMSDGFYIGGFWGTAPSTFIHLEDSGEITITAPNAVIVNTTNATINASGSVEIDTPSTHMTGTLTVDGKITGSGGLAVSGGGGATVSGDVVADGISLKSHTHTCPDGETGTPH